MKFQKMNSVILKSAKYDSSFELNNIGNYSQKFIPPKIMNIELEIDIKDFPKTDGVLEANEAFLNGIVDYQMNRKFGLGLIDLVQLIRNEYPEKFI